MEKFCAYKESTMAKEKLQIVMLDLPKKKLEMPDNIQMKLRNKYVVDSSGLTTQYNQNGTGFSFIDVVIKGITTQYEYEGKESVFDWIRYLRDNQNGGCLSFIENKIYEALLQEDLIPYFKELFQQIAYP